VGATTYIGNYCSIGDVDIANDVLIASHVSIMNGCNQHGIDRLDIPVREQVGVYDEVSIGEDTWIGERATIAASIGKHCVVGAGALVLKPLPDYAVAVGVPAKIIRDRRDIASADQA
jgi:virginiamycin A acetyltransferase